MSNTSKFDNKVSPCRHPLIIETRHNEFIQVPCGHCPDCLYKKGKHYESLINAESQAHQFVYFITLTYDEIYVPRAVVVPNHRGRITYVDVTRRPLKTRDYPKVFDTYRQEIATVDEPYNSPLFKKFYQRADIKPKYYEKKPYKNIRYLKKSDAQNFLKRLRLYLSEYSSESPRYFLTAEYGPDTFRPHFHLLLFFSDWRIVNSLKECLLRAWKFGTVDYQLTDASRTLYSYVSSYTTSASVLPRFLCSKSIAPFCLHSQRLGMQASKIIRNYIYAHLRESFDSVDVPYNGTVSTYYPTSSMQSLLFPRCYNYDRQSYNGLFQLYTVFERLSRYFHSDRPSDLTRAVLEYSPRSFGHNHISKYIYMFLRLLDIYPDFGTLNESESKSIYPNRLRIQPASYYMFFDYSQLNITDNYNQINDVLVAETKQVYSRIYTAINFSKHFLEFNCEGRSPAETISIIKEYYRLRPLALLKMQYETQEEYFNQFNTTDYDIFYSLIDDGSLQFMNKRYREIYDKSTPIKLVNSRKDEMYSRCVKHKEQNDRNGIFL